MSQFSNIPTNIISGFLGAGKTTAIRYLLQNKPSSERWAIIVNEFGKVGIDGALLKNDSVEIKEIPGGCLCCVGSQSLNVGLNQIIRKIHPQRILIEPTGLGHPKRLIDSLTGGYFKSVLDLKAVICLLDARQLKNQKYLQHQTFIDQLNIADVLIANKLDSYVDEDKQRFLEYANSFKPAKQIVAMVERGELNADWLDLGREQTHEAQFVEAHMKRHLELPQLHHLSDYDKLENEWQMIEGRSENYLSVGWRIVQSAEFNYIKLTEWLQALLTNVAVERIKGVVHTDRGWLSINHTQTEQQINDQAENDFSILEIIAAEEINSSQLDQELKALVSG